MFLLSYFLGSTVLRLPFVYLYCFFRWLVGNTFSFILFLYIVFFWLRNFGTPFFDNYTLL